MRAFRRLINARANAIRWLVIGALAAGISVANAETPIKAVWQVKEIYFPYFGLTTLYSCDGLRDKVRVILSKLGGREDSLVSVAGCTASSGPVRNPSVRIIVAHPVAATDAATIIADPKRAQLLSKLRHKGKTVSNDEPFDASVTRVALYSKSRATESAVGDCELLEQMRDRVIKPLGGTIVKDEMHCTPYQGTVGNQRLEVDILMPMQGMQMSER